MQSNSRLAKGNGVLEALSENLAHADKISAFIINTDKMRKLERGSSSDSLLGLQIRTSASRSELGCGLQLGRSHAENPSFASPKRATNSSGSKKVSKSGGWRWPYAWQTRSSLVRRSTDGSDWADSQVCLLVAAAIGTNY